MESVETKEYCVGLTMRNRFKVIADSEMHAREIVHNMGDFKLLDECEFIINYVDAQEREENA